MWFTGEMFYLYVSACMVVLLVTPGKREKNLTVHRQGNSALPYLVARVQDVLYGAGILNMMRNSPQFRSLQTGSLFLLYLPV